MTTPGNIIRGMPSSDLYDEHMQIRTFDDRLDVKADIRKINEVIEGLKQSYRIVDRLGEGMSPRLSFIGEDDSSFVSYFSYRDFLICLQGDRHRRLYIQE